MSITAFRPTIDRCPIPALDTTRAVGIYVFSRRFRAAGDHRWRTYSVVTAFVGPLIAIPPHTTSAGIRLATATSVIYLWLALYAIRLLRAPRH